MNKDPLSIVQHLF